VEEMSAALTPGQIPLPRCKISSSRHRHQPLHPWTEGLILQVHEVFTRIRSGALMVVSSGGARGLANYGAAMQARVDGWLDLL
jgi:hypothetical protein